MPLGAGHYPARAKAWLANGSPADPFIESFDRSHVAETDVAAALVTQVMTCVAVPLQIGQVITKIAVKSGATAASVPTNWWFALYSSAAVPALLAQTADQLTAAWAANTTQDIALATPQVITADGVYYVAIMVKATTVPSLPCLVHGLAGVSGGILASQKILAQTSGAALTTTAPATIASPTTSVNVPYVVLH